MSRIRPLAARRAFTIVEVIVVVSVIAVLTGLLLVGLSGARQSAELADSMARMRQVGTWMRLYATDNRDYVLPSQFDNTDNTQYPGKVRTGTLALVTPEIGQNAGTWADILWTTHEIAVLPDDGATGRPTYRFEAPDTAAYDLGWGLENVNPFRSKALNSRNTSPAIGTGDGLPTPYGDGARDVGKPGYFAANNFFNAAPGGTGYVTMGQIKAPDRSMYLVDSVAGETIEPAPEPYDATTFATPMETLEVDFRYNGSCLMLFMDGSVRPEGPWEQICDLEGTSGAARSRNIRIRDLTSRTSPCP